ncbi:unnamed protein product [Caenorhabditis auriculariae]|uniref:Uncharacterized protein n=1 Tax=Caenorhabditis auriculariae TaxID=2777116 RepID=A0A8S1H259_9PELO|nr:unnamed protein product [Caenorhabditis auriculariae]
MRHHMFGGDLWLFSDSRQPFEDPLIMPNCLFGACNCRFVIQKWKVEDRKQKAATFPKKRHREHMSNPLGARRGVGDKWVFASNIVPNGDAMSYESKRGVCKKQDGTEDGSASKLLVMTSLFRQGVISTALKKRRQFDQGIDPLDPESQRQGGHGGFHHGFPHGFHHFGGGGGGGGEYTYKFHF